MNFIKKFIFPNNIGLFKNVLFLAWPIILSNLSRVFMGIADVAMVGHLGAEALAATGMGNMLFWGALSFMIGVRTATQTVTARRLGEKKYYKCAPALFNGLLMGFAYSIPFLGIFFQNLLSRFSFQTQPHRRNVLFIRKLCF